MAISPCSRRKASASWISTGAPSKRAVQHITWDPDHGGKGRLQTFHAEGNFRTAARRARHAARAAFLSIPAKFFWMRWISPRRNSAIFSNVQIVACGTSWHAGLAGKFMIERLAQIPVEVDYGSEFRYRDPIVDPKTLTICISQSGETADTLAAQREAKQKGSKTLAICNVQGSMITREAAGTILTHAGPEIGVASTKAFTGQLTALMLLAMYLAQVRDTVTADCAK